MKLHTVLFKEKLPCGSCSDAVLILVTLHRAYLLVCCEK